MLEGTKEEDCIRYQRNGTVGRESLEGGRQILGSGPIPPRG